MMLILRNTAIVSGLIAVIAYAIYRYAKNKVKPVSSISYERILSDALSKIKSTNEVGDYVLIVFPPKKSKEFIDQHPGYCSELKSSDLNNNLLVIWLVQKGEDVIEQKAIIGKSLATDFSDIVPTNKIYKKQISIK